MIKRKNILVTGGAGFVGSSLCKYLASMDFSNIISLDNYITGSVENHMPNVTYISGSTENISDLITQDIDVVFHFGEYSRVEQSFDDCKLVFNSNSIGTQRVIEFCLDQDAKLIYAGSSTKFANEADGSRMSPYAFTKASNTDLIKCYGEWFNLRYAITYFYNVYGPREISSGKYATVVGIFKECFKNNRALPVTLPGSQKRYFTHVDDVVDALALIAEYGDGDGFGIGSTEEYSILDLAKLFSDNITFQQAQRGNRLSAALNVEPTVKLGWSPRRSLIDYINQIKASV